jgi:Na+/melibiose symporter-like transporter
VVFFFFYRIDRHRHAEITAALAARHAEKEAIAAHDTVRTSLTGQAT